MIEIVNGAKLQAKGKVFMGKWRTWEICRAFNNALMQDWLNENPELRENYLDWYEAKFVKAAGAGGTA